MKCNLIVEINEITIRDYSLIEDEGLLGLVSSRPGLSMVYEDDEDPPCKPAIVIKGDTLDSLLSFLSFTEIMVKIIK